MSSTHLSLHYHVIYSTKDRAPVIAPAWRERLHAYLGGVVRNIGGVAEAIFMVRAPPRPCRGACCRVGSGG